MNNKPTQVSPQNEQFSINNEALSVKDIKKEFLTIIDNFIEALKNTILVDLDKEKVDIVDALLHNIAIKNDLSFNDFSQIFWKDLRSPYEVNTEILNEINTFVSEYSEFFKWWDIFRDIFHKKWSFEYIWWDHWNEVQRLAKIISHNIWLKKCDLKSGWVHNTYLFNKEKSEVMDKLRNFGEIDLNILGYIVLLIFRNILNEQENVKNFLSYASIIQNSFTVKDTAFWERIDEFFLKHSTVESTVDKVSEAVNLNIKQFKNQWGNVLDGDEVPY